jgi:class 3 adenylate cyclase/tetratricopeptide (TPR) repeat protein
VNIEAWLAELGLEQYAEAFAENGVDLSLLPELTNEDLKDLGVDRLVDRKTILKAVAGTSESEDEPAAELSAATTIAGERRQVTVLFADIAGYTKLSSELGAESTHALLNRYFEAVDGIVDSYGGSIDKHIGDNVMAVFGAPVAHDDDPLRAVRAAFDIQQRMSDLSGEVGRAMQVHIGIASGQVVASDTGSDGHREYTVTGDSVNLASRLQERAEAGQTLISDAVQRTVANYIDCDALGEVVVKGLDGPVQVWRATGLSDERGGEPSGPFVGRQAERRQFAMLVEACLETGAGQAVLVRGEAGIGKTRLVDEFASLARPRGFTRHKGLALDFGVGKGQDAIQRLVRSLLGLATGGDKVARASALERAVEAGWLEDPARVFLNDLLDLPQPPALRALYDAMDKSTRDAGQRATVAALIRCASAAGPILVEIEDLHWADPALLAHLAEIAAAVANCPALLVMTSRSEGDPLSPAWRASLGGSPLTTMDLQPLRAAEAADLAHALAESGGAPIEDCIARAEGNPLFLEQLLRNAEEGAEGELPGSIHSLVLTRMDRLEIADKQALQAASVIGQRFAADALSVLVEDADYDCVALVAHNLVRPEGEDYMFAHALIREGAYSSLLQAGRRTLHRRAADWFAGRDPVLHAEHLERAADPGAAAAYRLAAEAQAVAYHYARALDLIERGLASSPDPAEAPRLICLKGDLLLDGGDAVAADAAHREARDRADDDLLRCRAEIGIAAGLRLVDSFDDAFAALDRAERLAEGQDWPSERARLHHLRGNLLFPLGQHERCREEHERALAQARAAGDPELEARSLGGLGDAAYAGGRLVTADSYYSQCIALCREHGFGRIEVANLAQLGGWGTRFYMGDVGGAIEISLDAVEMARAVGHDRAELISQSGCYMGLFSTGETAQARRHVERAKALIKRLGARRFLARALQYEGKIDHWEGRAREARAYLDEALAISRETGVRFVGPSILADIAFISDDPDESRAALAEGEALLADGDLSTNDFNFVLGAIDTSLRLGDWDEADRHAATLAACNAEEPLPLTDFFIARGRALAAFGRGKRDDTTMQELTRLRDEAERIGLKTALPALEEALATVQS